MVKRASWLSITPEPERELPEAVATLAAGRRAAADAVAAERDRIERLVLHGGQRRWLAYLHDVVDLIDRSRTAATTPTSPRARERATAVIANHHNLLLGAAPGPGAAGCTAADSSRLRALDRPTNRSHMSTTTTSTTTTPAATDLSDEQLALQQRAREFVEHVLCPLELEAEAPGGRLPERDRRADQARGDRGAPARRAGPGRARRPGLVDARVVPRQRAVRPRHQRPALARPERLQRVGRGQPRADRALRGAGAARRGRRRLRGHRGRGRLGSQRDRDDRGRHRRRLADQRREVVRDLRRRRPRADRDGQRRRRRRPAADAVPGRARGARASSSSTTRSTRTTIPTATRRSASPTSRSPPTRSIGGVGNGDELQRAGSPRSGWGSPPTGSARCGGCSTRRPPGR